MWIEADRQYSERDRRRVRGYGETEKGGRERDLLIIRDRGGEIEIGRECGERERERRDE